MCIVVQYFIRYYKYNLAQALDEKDHPYYSSDRLGLADPVSGFYPDSTRVETDSRFRIEGIEIQHFSRHEKLVMQTWP
ncbi:hypothetical protein M8J77_003215 [Diaphorina citri]|nr:hypothetical protein M8J77_003215 [Diaphorina citri]